jgi:hypothetical protein
MSLRSVQEMFGEVVDCKALALARAAPSRGWFARAIPKGIVSSRRDVPRLETKRSS